MVKMTEDEPGDEGPWPPPDSMATTSTGPICNTLIVDSIALAPSQKTRDAWTLGLGKPLHTAYREQTAEHDRLRGENERFRCLLLWALYHAQGSCSPVGQPIRAELGIGRFERLTDEQITAAKAAADRAWPEAHG